MGGYRMLSDMDARGLYAISNADAHVQCQEKAIS